MGTNFYIKLKGREKPVHIGKSSAGWAFNLHYIPGICENLDHWKDYINNKDNVIYNEYMQKVSPEELIDTITMRGYKGDTDGSFEAWDQKLTTEDVRAFERENHARYDVTTGLMRHTDLNFTVATPEGETYDLIEGDFC